MEVEAHVDEALGERHAVPGPGDHDLPLGAGAGVGVLALTDPDHGAAHLTDLSNLTPALACKYEHCDLRRHFKNQDTDL